MPRPPQGHSQDLWWVGRLLAQAQHLRKESPGPCLPVRRITVTLTNWLLSSQQLLPKGLIKNLRAGTPPRKKGILERPPTLGTSQEILFAGSACCLTAQH